jgi:hypothetical protein
VLDKNAFENAPQLNEEAVEGRGIVTEGEVADEIEKTFQLAIATDTNAKMDVCNKHSLTIQNNISNIHPVGGNGKERVCEDDYNMGF